MGLGAATFSNLWKSYVVEVALAAQVKKISLWRSYVVHITSVDKPCRICWHCCCRAGEANEKSFIIRDKYILYRVVGFVFLFVSTQKTT